MAVTSKTDKIKALIGLEFRLACFCLTKQDSDVSNETKLRNTVFTYKEMVHGTENIGTVQGLDRK